MTLTTLPPGPPTHDTQSFYAGRDPLDTDLPPGHLLRDTQNSYAGRDPLSVGGDPAIKLAPPRHPAPGADYGHLRLMAESYHDCQKTRQAIASRLRSGTDQEATAVALATMWKAETQLALAMKKALRVANPAVHKWAKETVGLGEHTMARLLGAIGDPAIASPYHWEGAGKENRVLVADEPYRRTVSQLWSYCGYGDATRKKRKGMTAEDAFKLGNPRAKMIVYLIAVGAMKCTGSAISPAPPMAAPPTGAQLLGGGQKNDDAHRLSAPADPSTGGANANAAPISASRRRSPYRDVYDLGRITYADRDGWTNGHQHAAGIRLVGKEILRDLWRVSQ